MGAKALLTVDQFEQLPETEGVSFELDEGELIEVSGPILRHRQIQTRLVLLLGSAIEKRNLGGTLIVEQEFRLSEGTVRRPDVAYIKAENVAGLDENESIQALAPDLIVEITSPSDTFDSLTRKTRQYLNAGTKSVWIVVTSMQEVQIHTAGASPRILGENDTLDDPTLLPGFSAPVASLFED